MSESYLISGIPAKWVDDLIVAGSNKKTEFLYDAVASLVATTVFPLFSAGDLLFYAAKGVGEWTWSKLSGNEEYAKSAEKSFTAAKRAFLGVTFSQWGWISPDLATQHAIAKVQVAGQISHGFGKLYSAAATQEFPTTVEEIKTVIDQAIRNRQKIAIVGAGMSQGKQALPPEGGIVLNLKNLKLEGKETQIEIDSETKTATVAAGVTWCDIQNAANLYNLAPRISQASNVFSIGGSTSANIHGWDIQGGTLSDTIESIKIMNAQGNIEILTPNNDLFRYVVGGYGGFGVILEVKLKLADNVMLQEKGIEINPANYLTHFKANVIDKEHIPMHLYRLSLDPDHLFETGIAVDYTQVGGLPSEKPTLIDEPERGYSFNRVCLHIFRRFRWARKLFWWHEKADATTAKIATRNEFMRPPIKIADNGSHYDTEWLQEFFVPGERLEGFLAFLANKLKENNVPVLNASVRYVKQDTHTELSYANQGNRFAVVLFFNQKLHPDEVEKTKHWVRETIDEITQDGYGGSYYLPYQHFATKEQFKKSYPNWQAVANKKKEVDPNQIFMNGLHSDYLNIEES